MKAVILAGGLGTRFSEETTRIPKPLIEIGGKPILWHIMKIYSAHGINDFIICLGYKGYLIKEYFQNYSLHMSDITLDFRNRTQSIHQNFSEPWKVTLVDTGEKTQIGGRIKKILPYVRDDNLFCLTYGDGVGDIDISAAIDLHKRERRLATVTGTRPPGRFGALNISGNKVVGFREKPLGDGGWINGGFFILNPAIDKYIDEGDEVIWEREPMERLAANGELNVFHHEGFWQPMDTLRDKLVLEEMWQKNQAPWKIW
jgi:glucose-1-phosphate cytidylyltransferase